jgi:hypothetical protein
MRRLIRRPSAAMVVACIALLVTLGGTSYATALNVPRNSVGTLELQRNAVKAAKIAPNAVRTSHVLDGSLLVADFKAGQIPQGPKGEKGDKGDKGSTGLSGVEIVQVAGPAQSVIFTVVSAECPAGKRIIGGGAHTFPLGDAYYDDIAIVSSYPTTPTRWQAVASEVNATAGNWTLTVYAICAIVT